VTAGFTIKQLQASITINPSSSTPTFNGSSDNTVTFGGAGSSAVRMKASIHNAGGIDGKLDLSVWGLPLSVMSQLSTYGQQINLLPKNQIILQAGDSESGLSQAYVGSIIASVIDFHQPDAPMRITANAAAAFAAVAATPSSYNGAVQIATAMQAIAQAMGLTFENNGVTGALSNVYLYGSPRDQYNELVQHADISATIDRGVLAIWPKFKNRNAGVITISPQDNTMFDYPAYTSTGVMFQAPYNPGFAIGKQVTIKGSQLQPANATWNIYSVNHELECQTPGGKWESVLFGTSPNFATPVTTNG
jgi:sulfur transfer protein SufE